MIKLAAFSSFFCTPREDVLNRQGYVCIFSKRICGTYTYCCPGFNFHDLARRRFSKPSYSYIPIYITISVDLFGMKLIILGEEVVTLYFWVIMTSSSYRFVAFRFQYSARIKRSSRFCNVQQSLSSPIWKKMGWNATGAA